MRSINFFQKLPVYLVLLLPFYFNTVSCQEFDEVSSDDCLDCHEESKLGTDIAKDLSYSIHEGLECQDCHQNITVIPHKTDKDFTAGCEGCRDCHETESAEYTAHGRSDIAVCADAPSCSSCHGDHDILPANVKNSKVHPSNLPVVCGQCHENIDLIKKYDLFMYDPVKMYKNSVHGRIAVGGMYSAATCSDCHSSDGTTHKIFSAGDPKSAINHFNIPATCGKCHQGVEKDYWDGIHGKLVARGQTDSPVCTDCHGEHGIISPNDPRSPVSKTRLSEATCTPCHDSARLNEKYKLPADRIATFVDTYHGLKSEAGDTHVANCASCHGVHRILPSTDSTSTIFPANLQSTCGECHPGISKTLAQTPIHSNSGESARVPLADIIEVIYIWAIIIIIGLMVIHWLLDLIKKIRLMMKLPQVRRMYSHEVLQHTFLMLSFIVLVITGFSLRFNDTWMTKFFFGHEGGFVQRGLIHRVSAAVFIGTVVWHLIFLVITRRGKIFLKDMLPVWKDFKQFFQQMRYYLGLRQNGHPQFDRFSYVEKAEYWALVWGAVVMIITGLLLWFDNYFTRFLPKGFLDVALVVHYWEAWLATLAIIVWHLYSTVFSPDVYPMNPSWLTGTMPDTMYTREHPAYVDKARQEMKDQVRKELERMKGSVSERDKK